MCVWECVWEGQALNAVLFRADFTAGWSQASMARPSRQLQALSSGPLDPSSLLRHKGGPAWPSAAQHGPVQHGRGWQAAVANDGNCVRYACVMSGGCGGRHANGAGKREIERPPSCPVQSEGFPFLWDYLSFFSLFTWPICFSSIIFSSSQIFSSKTFLHLHLFTAIQKKNLFPMQGCCGLYTGGLHCVKVIRRQADVTVS